MVAKRAIRNAHWITNGGIQAARRALPLLVMLAGYVTTVNNATAQTQTATVRRWQIEATVVQIDDPDGNFPEVRLGDPVYGALSYNLAIVADALTDEKAIYTHASSFRVATMTIDNPRTEESMTFIGEAGSEHDIHVYNDNEYGDEVFDYMLALQSVLPPPGVDADFPVIAIELSGPTDVIHNYDLPPQLNLDDWPVATIAFNDLLGDLAIYAEINSLTPVEVPIVSGDFDFDGDVDGEDLVAWTIEYGEGEFFDADANGDRQIDGADFLVWQRSYGEAVVSNAVRSNVAVPEPEASVYFLSLIAVIWRKRHEHLDLKNDYRS